MKRNAKVATPKKVEPHPGYYASDQVAQRAEILAITARDAEWKCEGFADMVVEKGFGAMGPPERNGRLRTWQGIGRTLFGDDMFKRHMAAAVERKRAARAASMPVR